MLFFSPDFFLSYRTWVALGAAAEAFQWLWGWRRWHSLVTHGRWAAGSASGDEAPGLSEGAVHNVSGSLPTAQQTLPARGNPNQVMQVKHWGGIIRIVNQKVKDHFQIAGVCCRRTVFRLLLVLWCSFSFCLSQEAKLCCTFLFCRIHLRSLCTVIYYEHHMMWWSVSFNFICQPFCFICMSKYHWGLKEDILLHSVSSDCGWVLVLWWISSLGPQIELFLVVLRTIQSLSLSTERCHNSFTNGAALSSWKAYKIHSHKIPTENPITLENHW